MNRNNATRFAKGGLSLATGNTDPIVQNTTYIRSLYNPEEIGPQFYPNLDFTPCVLKAVRIESNEALVQTDGLFLCTMGSYGAKLRWYIRSTTDGKYYYYRDVKPNQDLAENFLSARTTAGILKFSSASVAAGVYALSGVFYTVAVMDLPDITQTLTLQNLSSYAKNSFSFAESKAEDGIVNLWQPTGINPFRTPVNPYLQDISETIFTRDRGDSSPTNWTTGGYDTNLGLTNHVIIPNNAFGGLRITFTVALNAPTNYVITLYRTSINAAGTVVTANISSQYAGNFQAGANVFVFSELPANDVVGPVTRISLAIGAPVGIPGESALDVYWYDRNVDNYVDPATVVVYSGMTAGQQMLISGQINLEAVPNAQLAPNVPTIVNAPGYQFDFLSSFIARHESYGFPFVMTMSDWKRSRISDQITPPLVAAGFTDLLKGVSKFLPMAGTAVGSLVGMPAIGAELGAAAETGLEALLSKGYSSTRYALGRFEDEAALLASSTLGEIITARASGATVLAPAQLRGIASSSFGRQLAAAKMKNGLDNQQQVPTLTQFPTIDSTNNAPELETLACYDTAVYSTGDGYATQTRKVVPGGLESVVVAIVAKEGVNFSDLVWIQAALARLLYGGNVAKGVTVFFPDLTRPVAGLSCGLAMYISITGMASPNCMYSGGLVLDESGAPDLLAVAAVGTKINAAPNLWLITPGPDDKIEEAKWSRNWANVMKGNDVIQIRDMCSYYLIYDYVTAFTKATTPGPLSVQQVKNPKTNEVTSSVRREGAAMGPLKRSTMIKGTINVSVGKTSYVDNFNVRLDDYLTALADYIRTPTQTETMIDGCKTPIFWKKIFNNSLIPAYSVQDIDKAAHMVVKWAKEGNSAAIENNATALFASSAKRRHAWKSVLEQKKKEEEAKARREAQKQAKKNLDFSVWGSSAKISDELGGDLDDILFKKSEPEVSAAVTSTTTTTTTRPSNYFKKGAPKPDLSLELAKEGDDQQIDDNFLTTLDLPPK